MTAARGIGKGRNSGGRNPGAGRPFGSRNRKSRELVMLADEKKQKLPLPFLLELINDPEASRRDKLVAAGIAAPYVHIRLSPKNPPVLSPEEIGNLSDEALISHVARLEGEVRKLPARERAIELADQAEHVLEALPSLSPKRQQDLLRGLIHRSEARLRELEGPQPSAVIEHRSDPEPAPKSEPPGSPGPTWADGGPAQRACRKLWRRPHDGLCSRLQFHALLTCGRPKQTASSRFCSHTVQAPAKPKPLRSHSMASNPWIVRRAVWKD